MGVVASGSRSHRLGLLFTCIYALPVSVIAAYHEHWADEAQAWLLARDNSLVALWTHWLHYEGTPGLWHTLLSLLAKARLPYESLALVSTAAGMVSAYLTFRFSPFPVYVRLLLPFTYFFAYQYAVVARSYVLIPPLLFTMAALYTQRARFPWVFACCVSALALVSVHGLIVACAVVLFLRPLRPAGFCLFLAATGLSMWSAFPAGDVMFVRAANYSVTHYLATAAHALEEAFTANWPSALLLIALTVPFLIRGHAFSVFLLSAWGILSLSAFVYGQVWHYGLLFVFWIFALWIAALQASRPRLLVNAPLMAAIVIQCFWTASAGIRELRTAYSGSLAAATYLKEQHIPQQGIFGVGYACVGVQPYFPQNIFQNFQYAFWDWSSANHMIADYQKLPLLKPRWVLVGYKTAEENYLWNSEVRRSGYRKVKHFEGNVIWEDEQLEPESFDLYQIQ